MATVDGYLSGAAKNIFVIEFIVKVTPVGELIVSYLPRFPAACYSCSKPALIQVADRPVMTFQAAEEVPHCSNGRSDSVDYSARRLAAWGSATHTRRSWFARCLRGSRSRDATQRFAASCFSTAASSRMNGCCRPSVARPIRRASLVVSSAACD